MIFRFQPLVFRGIGPVGFMEGRPFLLPFFKARAVALQHLCIAYHAMGPSHKSRDLEAFYFERQAATVAAARVDFFADMKHGKIRQHEKKIVW